MNRRVTPEIAALARQLLDLGWPQRLIARQLHISVPTVSRIATGQWKPATQREDPLAELEQSATRCPGCGGLVYHWPCLACELRAKAERRSA